MHLIRKLTQILLGATLICTRTFKRFWNYVKKVIRENKVATVIGILIGGVGTRFLEDGNLLVTSLLTGMSVVGVLVVCLVTKRLINKTQ